MKEQKLITLRVDQGEISEKNSTLRELLSEGWVIRQFTSSSHPTNAPCPVYITILLERTQGE